MPKTKADVAAGRAKGPGGTDPYWSDPVALQHAIDAYFDKDGPKSIYGMSLELGFISHSSMYDYIKRGDECSTIVKRARSRMLAYYDETGQDRKSNGHFCDRMLSRMGEIVVERQEVQVQAVSMLDAAAIVAGELPPAERRVLPVESREVPPDDVTTTTDSGSEPQPQQAPSE
jgi:hypothetical protein